MIGSASEDIRLTANSRLQDQGEEQLLYLTGERSPKAQPFLDLANAFSVMRRRGQRAFLSTSCLFRQPQKPSIISLSLLGCFIVYDNVSTAQLPLRLWNLIHKSGTDLLLSTSAGCQSTSVRGRGACY